MSKVILVINAIVNKGNMDEVQSYLGKVMPVFGKNGGKPIGRYKIIKKLIGDENTEMMALIEFSDERAIDKMINGEEFKSLTELRGKAFLKLNMSICSEM